MTSLSLTVCAHIAATLYTPRFCAFDYRFLPFPNLTPNPLSALHCVALAAKVMGRGMGLASRIMPFVSRVAEMLGRGMGMAPSVESHASLAVEVMERGMGMAPAGVPYASRVVEVLGRGMGMAPGLCPMPRRWWGQWEVSCAGPQRSRGQSARKPARTLAHSLATP